MQINMNVSRYSSKLNTKFLFGFGQKGVIRKLLILAGGVFFDRTFFLSKNIDIFSNLNYYELCKEEKKKFQTSAVKKLCKISRF